MDILLNMFFIYTCILHSSIVVINIAIIFKEISIEFFELYKVSGGAGSDYNLNMARIVEDFEEEMWYMDPVRIFKYTFSFIFGDNLTDEIRILESPQIDAVYNPLIDTLGPMADYGNPKESMFNYDPYTN